MYDCMYTLMGGECMYVCMYVCMNVLRKDLKVVMTGGYVSVYVCMYTY